MLDWLVEVTSAFKCRERTYFLCAGLFDNFLSKFPEKLENKDVHGIGITCLYLGSKYEDVFPLTSDVISDKVTHGAFSQSNIKTREMIMLQTLNFEIDLVTHFDFLTEFLRISNLQTEPPIDLKRKLKELSTLIVMMSMQHNDISMESVSKVTVCAVLSACGMLQMQ